MAHMRLISLGFAAVCAGAGLTAGALCLMAGAIDQAVAFTWPGLAAGIAFALAAPGEATG